MKWTFVIFVQDHILHNWAQEIHSSCTREKGAGPFSSSSSLSSSAVASIRKGKEEGERTWGSQALTNLDSRGWRRQRGRQGERSEEAADLSPHSFLPFTKSFPPFFPPNDVCPLSVPIYEEETKENLSRELNILSLLLSPVEG